MRSLLAKFHLMRGLISFAFVAIFSIFVSQTAVAYQVSPLHHYLDLSGKGATSYLTIDNTHGYPLTVEMTIQRRNMKNGEVLEDIPSDDDFLIFPPQAIIAPGKKQRVQIRYVGSPLENSEFYRLVVKQVPIKLPKQESAQLDIAYNFISAVYVAPKGAKADLNVSSITPVSAGGYDVVISNAGSYHALLPSFTWNASDGTQSSALDVEKFPFGERPFIEPGGVRTVTIPQGALGDMKTLSNLELVEVKKSG